MEGWDGMMISWVDVGVDVGVRREAWWVNEVGLVLQDWGGIG